MLQEKMNGRKNIIKPKNHPPVGTKPINKYNE